MIADAPRSKDDPNENAENTGNVIHRELKGKESIKNYIKGII